MKKRGLLFIIFIIMLLFVSCGDDTTSKVSISHVEVEKIEISGADNEFVFQKFGYNRSSSIVVTAYYTDSSNKDVTSESSFSRISTVDVGIKEVIVTYTYYGKTVSNSYEVNVLEYGVESLTVDTSNTKLIYQVGEKLDLKGLKVYGTYSNGTKRLISSYDTNISDVGNNKIKVDTAFRKAGSYDVEITYQDGKVSYPIYVYKKEDVSYHFLVSNSIDYIEGADIDFEAAKTIFKSPYANVTPKGKNITYNYDDVKYDNTEYTGGLKVQASNITFEEDDTNGVAITLLADADIIIVLNNSNLVVRGMNDRVYSYIGKKTGMTEIALSLTRGSYYLNSIGDSIIYDILFNFHDVTNYEHYDSLAVNLNELKINYSYFENLDVSNLKLYGLLDDEKEEILSSEYKIELFYSNQVVSHFWYEGDYKVRVTYLGGKYCLNPMVEYTVNYSIKEVERYYLNMISINGKELELESQKFAYNYETNNDSIILNVSNLANTDIYVNNELYTQDMIINLEDDVTEIIVEIRENPLISYLITINKIK